MWDWLTDHLTNGPTDPHLFQVFMVTGAEIGVGKKIAHILYYERAKVYGGTLLPVRRTSPAGPSPISKRLVQV